MKFNGKLDEAEAVGIISVKGITFDVEVTAEETVTFMKQLLPIAREFKSLRIFEREKDNEGLCRTLNEVRDEKRETDREYRQAKAASDLEKSRLQEKVKELEEKLRKAETQVPQPLQPVQL